MQFSFHAAIKFDDVQASEEKIQFGATNDISVRRPDQFLPNMTGIPPGNVFWYNGQILTLYDGVYYVYATEKVPPSIDVGT